MVDTQKLKGLIVEHGYSQKDMAEMLGITPSTWFRRMDRGVFGSDEIAQLMKILNISDPTPIFFNQDVTYEVTKKDT